MYQSLSIDIEIASRMVRIIKTMDEQGFDLATFMWHLSWFSTATTRDEAIKYARTALLHCDEFPLMLRKWRNGRAAAGTKGARDSMDTWSVEDVKMLMNVEMRQLAPFMRSPPNELTEESLLAIRLPEFTTQIQTTAPVTFDPLHALSTTPAQRVKNTLKDQRLVSFTIIIFCPKLNKPVYNHSQS